ncbi:Radical SAM domain protein [Methanolacinia petrolearia DSM 11571]|uniref:7-carboxy-7-deazaguanine synthase n=1 Tax=Methanolacinia petrolearia (strain DSM 11571 / OCM 486 / SEBR 4847) TaxID=679926 RepID=E1RHZ6_METP4|nr:radical SAM protein [Methanolacinia petrolearia]ADN35381.1 Radical SAM domain protein [Methanolacinia petrolearia DSM 11571]
MKVFEIFPSIQGEGPYQGIPSAFIRLSGCNLRCRWCDTPKTQDGSSSEEMTVDEVFGQVKKLGLSHVCITGGEPLIQQDELLSLLKDLHEDGYIVEIETNGTIDPVPVMEYSSVCMDIKCPSSGEKSFAPFVKKLRPSDCVKFVVEGKEDLEYMTGLLDDIPSYVEVCVSPVWGSDSRFIADYIMKLKRPVRFQLQLHKILGVN